MCIFQMQSKPSFHTPNLHHSRWTNVLLQLTNLLVTGNTATEWGVEFAGDNWQVPERQLASFLLILLIPLCTTTPILHHPMRLPPLGLISSCGNEQLAEELGENFLTVNSSLLPCWYYREPHICLIKSPPPILEIHH